MRRRLNSTAGDATATGLREDEGAFVAEKLGVELRAAPRFEPRLKAMLNDE